MNDNMRIRSNGVRCLGWLLLGLIPVFIMEAVNQLVCLAGIGGRMVWLIASGVQGTYYDLLVKASEFLSEHTMELTIVFQLVTLLIIFLWYWFAFAREKKLYKPSSVFTVKHSVIKIVILAFAASRVTSLVLILEGVLFPKAMENYSQIMETSEAGAGWFVIFISSIIFAPIVEELVFRGLTTEILKRTGWRFGIVNMIQALLFGMVHRNLIQGIYAFLLGLLLGYVCEKYGSLRASMVLHGCINIGGSYLSQLLGMVFKDGNTWSYAVLALGMLGVVLMFLMVRLIQKEVEGKRQIEGAGYGTEPGKDE